MQSETINGQAVEICVIAEDGSELAEGLTAHERELLERIDATLRADAGFKAAHAEAKLVRVDSNRGLADTDEGRFYLRYQHQGGMAEFWGNLADVLTVDIKGGIVGVAG
jgi:hypothetical protein